MPTLTKKIFLSSTFIDLKDYRKAAVHACHRVGLIPVYMEDFPPDPRDASAFCKAKVEESDLFLGIYAHRYGYVPDGYEVSITEMEYDWAMERKLPVHPFVIDPDYPWPASKVDKGKDSERLDLFKKRIGKHKWKTFQDVGTFKEDVLLLCHDLARANEATSPSTKSALARRSLPTPPEMHSVPPYIQTTRFIGRGKELDALDAWAHSSDTMLVVEAIGGVGKSALTWEWARDRAMKAILGLSGIFWWSFYEGRASFAEFVREALAYVTETDPEELQAVSKDEQVQRLVTELRRRPYLLVLDGFERLLIAYHQPDPSKLRDDQVDFEHRACTNPQAAHLLQQFTTCSPSKTLLTTRLIPLALENRAHQLVPSVRPLKLQGLDPADGENLLKSFGVHGASDAIRQFLWQFDNHSLLISVLAGRILDYRPGPGDFARWLADPKGGGSLHLSELDLKQRRTHILAYAFEGLDLKKTQMLSRIAVLSDAADYATLSILNPYLPPAPEKIYPPKPWESEFDLSFLRGELKERQEWSMRARSKHAWLKQQISQREANHWVKHNQQSASYEEYQNELKAYLASPKYKTAIAEFDVALSDLENRGLLQWDRHSDTYDLHPVVRGYAFDQIEQPEKMQTYERLRDHFESLPPEDFEEATELTQIKNTIQIYRALLGAGQIDKAADLYYSRLSKTLLFSIASYPTVVEMLTPIVPDDLQSRPPLASIYAQSAIAQNLGIALKEMGRLEEAQRTFHLSVQIYLEAHDLTHMPITLNNLSFITLDLNKLALSHSLVKVAHEIALAKRDFQETSACLLTRARLHSVEGRWKEVYDLLKEFSLSLPPPDHYYSIVRYNLLLCWLHFWQGTLQNEELEVAISAAIRDKRFLIQSKIFRLMAENYLSKGDLEKATEAADYAIEIARKTGASDPNAQGCLARALALQGRHDEARRLAEESRLKDNWQAAEVFLKIGDTDKAKEYALRAYKKAWADGPPHVLWWPLENSKRILARLSIAEPQLPPFDPSKIEPIPYEAEIRAAIEELKAKKEKN